MRGVLLSVLGGLACLPTWTQAASCREVVEKLNQQLATPVEVAALAETLATLGKTAGKDAAQDKPTFVSLMGLAASQAYAQQLRTQALASLQVSGLENTEALQALADMLVNRQH